MGLNIFGNQSRNPKSIGPDPDCAQYPDNYEVHALAPQGHQRVGEWRFLGGSVFVLHPIG